ncbi:MAG: O-linked GlcNAc transferase [Planctomycetota bacterium]|nr:O-linked GlcNAc transferase [Planctomycetota bacterium]
MNESVSILLGKRIAFVGKLGALSRKEAMQLVRDHGGIPLERVSNDVDLVIIGADELPAEDISALLSESIRQGLREGRTTLIHEHELWLQLGVVDESTSLQLYTPAMVAGLVKTPVRNIRRWYRMGLLTSAKVAHRLPYFQFVQVQNARQLVNWIGRGAHPSDIKRQLVDFSIWVENRSFMELDLVVDGRRLLLRHGDQLLGANGQLHLDFDRTEAFDAPESTRTPPVTATIPFQSESHPANSNANDVQNWTREEMLQAAEELEDDGRLEQSIGWYRIILARYGMTAEICFQLAELLYRTGDVSAARERYYNAIELDEDFIEARANLGCVLAETGQTILAVAAFQGALSRDDSYPDVHYHLAKCLDEIAESDQAVRHWIRFLQLSPQSPWAEEALDRLGRV